MYIMPIPDREAARLLGVTYETIRNAVRRGDLTRVPMTGQLQHVAREQVVLFEGMKQVRKGLLTREMQALWDEVEERINSTISTSQQEEKKVGEYVSKEVAIEMALILMDKALRGEIQLTRTPLKEKLAPFMDEGSLSRLTTLLEMLEVAAKNHNEELLIDAVNRVLIPLHNAPSQIFFEVLFYITAILQEHECLHEMPALREALSAA